MEKKNTNRALFEGELYKQMQGTLPYQVALNNGWTVRELQEMISLDDFKRDAEAIIEVWEKIKAFDWELCLHGIRAGLYAAMIARRVKKSVTQAFYCGLLHDVGKIEISKRILYKPSRLNEFEYAEIQEHPTRGWKLLRQHDLNDVAILHAVKYHHANFDQGGYPKERHRRKLMTCIVSIADSFDAITSSRPYQRGRTVAEAMEELRKGCGSQFHGGLVKRFLGLNLRAFPPVGINS